MTRPHFLEHFSSPCALSIGKLNPGHINHPVSTSHPPSVGQGVVGEAGRCEGGPGGVDAQMGQSLTVTLDQQRRCDEILGQELIPIMNA